MLKLYCLNCLHCLQCLNTAYTAFTTYTALEQKGYSRGMAEFAQSLFKTAILQKLQTNDAQQQFAKKNCLEAEYNLQNNLLGWMTCKFAKKEPIITFPKDIYHEDSQIRVVYVAFLLNTTF